MAVGTVFGAVALGWLTDDVVLPEFEGAEAGRSRAVVIGAVVGVAAARSIGVVVRRYFAGMTVFRSKDDLQEALGDQYLALPAEQLRVAPKGRYLAHVDSDVDVATDMLSPLPFTIGVLTLIGVSIVSLALVDWTLTLVALALVPLVAVLNHANTAMTKGPAVDARESVAAVSGVASESFDGALVVKTLGRERAELDRFSVAAAGLRDNSVRLGRYRAIFAAALDLLPDIGVVVLVVVGAWRVGDGVITTGQLVQAVALFSVLVFPLRVIGYFFGDMPPSVVAHDRVSGVLALPTERARGSGVLDDGPLSVCVDRVTIRRGEAAVVRDASLRVAAGEVIALVGRTGSGKSTLLTAVADMVEVEEGSITVGGIPLGDVAAASLTGRVAVAWQEPFLLGASVRENIVFGATHLTEADVAAAARAARLDGVVAALAEGYATPVGERGVRLSGGQRQRLALARAFARRPGLLLLDDATSAVDPVIEEGILASIRDMGSTMLIVAHRRSTIALADRVAMMADGHIVAVGTHDELSGNAAYVALLEAYDQETAS